LISGLGSAVVSGLLIQPGFDIFLNFVNAPSLLTIVDNTMEDATPDPVAVAVEILTPYSPFVPADLNAGVTVKDINRAIDLVCCNINRDLFCDFETYKQAYFYLAAHYLVVSLRNSSQGLSGNFQFLESSKSVGSVSAGYSIPQKFLDNPEYSMLAKTQYGALYLELILPLLKGAIFHTQGRTLP
jgi:hypothetical protein